MKLINCNSQSHFGYNLNYDSNNCIYFIDDYSIISGFNSNNSHN